MNMKYLKVYYCCVLALLLSVCLPVDLSAQSTRIIRGLVTDKSDGLPLPGANVIIKNENDRFIQGVTTDVDGRYMINVTIPNAVLQITFIGYKPYSVPVTNQTTVNVALETETQQMGEVVISAQAKPKVDLGGYMQIDRRDNASSVTSIDMRSIPQSSATSAIEMMQGRAAGVQITAESGDPGAGYTVKVRGSSSINSSNNPLFVIDGIQYTGSVGDFSSINELLSARSPLQDVHPEDIASIEVLKDAGSTAIYGSRGANGVVMVTTKRGRANDTQIKFASDVSLSFAPKDIPLLSGDDLKVFILEGMQNRSGYSTSSPEYPMLRDDLTRADYYEYNNNTDWVKEVQQVAYTYKNNLALSGGGNSTVYRFSMGSTNQQGTIIGKSYDMFSTRFSLDYIISKNLKLATTIGYTRSNTKRGGDDVKDFQGVLGAARNYPSFYPVYWPDENGNPTDKYYVPFNTNISLYSKDMYNPVAWGNQVTNNTFSNTFISSIQLEFNVLEGLRVLAKLNFDFSNNSYKMFIPHAVTNRNWNDEKVNVTRIGKNNSQYIGQETIISYARTINQIHSLSLTGTARFDWNYDSSFSQGATNTGSTLVTGMAAATRWNDLSSERGHDVRNMLLIMGHYKLLDRYILQPSFNIDGTSRFGAGNRFGSFPQVSVSWRISSEPFMQSLTFMDDVKFRYSWGKSGNTPSDKYLYFAVYDAGSRYLDQVGTASSGLQLNTLRWETATTNNVGLDAVLFDSRLSFSVELYDKLINDQLMKRSLPSSSGYGDYWANFGTVRNRGFEFEGRVTAYQSKDYAYRWEIYGNIAIYRNKIEKLPEDTHIDIDWHNDYPFVAREGDPIGSFYGLKYKGVYATEEDAVARDKDGNPLYDMDGKLKPVRWDNANGYTFQAGDAIYEDMNYDGLINDADRTIIGYANPSFFGGAGTNFTFGNWRVDVFFQYQYGNDVINMVRKSLETMDGGNEKNINQSRSVMRRWRKQGDITDMPRVTFDTHYNAQGSDRFVEDASYCRLKSVSISYIIPRNFTSKIGIKSASAFITGYNLYTWSKYTGVDPEIKASGTKEKPFRVGLDESRTPVPRSFTAGLSITF
jgi:TonB-linked SusC/RagA family outer membrane protein